MPNIINVIVTTFDPVTDEDIGTRRINFNSVEDRKWYIRNFWWAILNNKGIEVVRGEQSSVDASRELPFT